MRSIATIFCLALLVTAAAAAQTKVPAPAAQPGGQQPAATATPAQESAFTADQLLQRGRDDYRAARYAEAVQELRAASAAFLSPEEKQRYIDTGKLATLPQVEQSLVYLALAYSKLGKEPEARDAVMRLANAERIAPTFATLPLDPETADFPQVVARVAPNVTLPQNAQLAYGGVAATPASTVAQAAVPQVVPPQPAATPTATAAAQPAAAPAQPAAPTAVAQAAPAVPAVDRAAMLKQMDEQVAAARAEIDREAASKIAEAQRQADARVAAEKAAADKAAQQKIDAERAAAERAAAEQIAADRAAIQRDAEAKIAAQRAAADKAAQDQAAAAQAVAATAAAQQKAAAEQAAAEKQAQARIAAAQAESEQQRTWLTTIRQAESLAESGNLDEANRMYVAVANAPNAPREIIAAAATGLYRTSDFRDAVAAFKRLAGFARGEEDLRYYNAVSLFEIGRFDEAKLELACALPFIQATDDVLRYRSKIEQMPAQQAMK